MNKRHYKAPADVYVSFEKKFVKASRALRGKEKNYPITVLYHLKISRYLCAVSLLLASCREVCEIMQNSEYPSSYQPLSRIKNIHREVFKNYIAVRKNSDGLVTENIACKNCRP